MNKMARKHLIIGDEFNFGDYLKWQSKTAARRRRSCFTWLYANYLQWSTRANKSPVAIRRFRELLIQTCTTLKISVHESKHTTGMGLNGLRIKQDDNQHQGWCGG